MAGRANVTVPKLLGVLAVLATAAAAGCLSAQPEQPEQMEEPAAAVSAGGLSAQDIHEIEELVQGYTRGIDVGPEDASWVFADDAVFEYTAGSVQGGIVSGAAELKAFYANLRATNTTRHVLSNLVIEPTLDGARGSVYMTSLDQTADAPVAVTAFGMYEDEFVQTPDGWRIQRRTYTQLLPAAGAQ